MKIILSRSIAYLKSNKWFLLYIIVLLLILPLTVILAGQQQNKDSHASAIPLAIDIQAGKNQSTPAATIVSPSFSTRAGNELIVVFLASDGSSTGSQAFTSVSYISNGKQIDLVPVRRSNGQKGTAEVWYTYSQEILSNVQVTAVRQNGKYQGLMRVVTFKGADKVIGTSGIGSAATGVASVSLTTTRAGSMVFGIANDPTRSLARTVSNTQKIVQQFQATKINQTFWAQRYNGKVPGIQPVVLGVLQPTTDAWNMVAVEVKQAEEIITPSPTSGGAPIGTTYSIWNTTAVPANPADNDTQAVEVGVKFKSDVDGKIAGVRYYKSSTNTGVHVGNLWTGTGQILASATFSNETEEGWQQVIFSQPILVTANTVYVASYHTNVGHYAGDNDYFATQGVDNAPLHALANSAGGNGVYAYGASSSFPTQTYQASNYWVDVLFQNSDGTLPKATPTSPSAGGGSATPTPTVLTPTPTIIGTTGPSACPPFPAFPDANCTGYKHVTGFTNDTQLSKCNEGDAPAGSADNFDGYLEKDNMVYDRCLFTDVVHVRGANVTVKNSKIIGFVTSDKDGTYAYNYRGLKLIDVELSAFSDAKLNTYKNAEQELADATARLAQATTPEEKVEAQKIKDAALNAVVLLETFTEDSLGQRDTIEAGDNISCTRCYLHHLAKAASFGSNSSYVDSYVDNITWTTGQHGAAIGSNGGANNVQLIHNNLNCYRWNYYSSDFAQGCSSSLSIYNDYGPVTNILVKNNLFRTAGGYCVYADGPNGTGVQFIDNHFGKGTYYNKNKASSVTNNLCGWGGPVTAWPAGKAGNVWSGNVWDDGSGIVNP